jgi:RNA polymerase sigma-70 factor (ECF subfamily)
MLVNLSPPPYEAPPLAALRETDETLARRARGDPGVFAELYRRHVDRIYRYHWVRTGDSDDAQDLTSQTFLAALENIETFRGNTAFQSWLFGLASHKVGDYHRRRRPSVPLDSAGELRDPHALPEDIVWQRDRLARISEALHAIAPDRAEAVALRIFAGMSAAEAGGVMGKSDTAVRMLVHRGLRDLHARLAAPEEGGR